MDSPGYPLRSPQTGAEPIVIGKPCICAALDTLFSIRGKTTADIERALHLLAIQAAVVNQRLTTPNHSPFLNPPPPER